MWPFKKTPLTADEAMFIALANCGPRHLREIRRNDQMFKHDLEDTLRLVKLWSKRGFRSVTVCDRTGRLPLALRNLDYTVEGTGANILVSW
jgi:hypothetical protein